MGSKAALSHGPSEGHGDQALPPPQKAAWEEWGICASWDQEEIALCLKLIKKIL
jgi:hypothetical protein